MRLTSRAPGGDLKAMHDLVLQAALAGEQPRSVLWAQPSPSLLLIRHDRPIRATDLPPGWVEVASHAPYWVPPEGAAIDWAVIVDAGQSGQTRAQWEKEVADLAAGRLPSKKTARPAPKARQVRSPERMLEVITGRLAPILDVTSAVVASHTHRIGRRPKEGGRIMHSNQVLLRGAGTVTDGPALHQLMAEGIGRHKSFGCGLILTRPVVAARGVVC